MRKLLVTAVASCALVAVVPATAMARGHHRHHSRIHHRTFGGRGWHLGEFNHAATLTPVATVTSFTNNVLTITDNAGNASSGQVTSDTKLICVQAPPTSTSTAPTSTTTPTGMEGDHGGFSRFGGGHGFGDPGFGHHDQGNQGDEQQGENDNDNDQDDQQAVQCDPTTVLVAGTPVLNAELTIGSSGSVWERVVVEVNAQPTSTAPTSTAPTTG